MFFQVVILLQSAYLSFEEVNVFSGGFQPFLKLCDLLARIFLRRIQFFSCSYFQLCNCNTECLLHMFNTEVYTMKNKQKCYLSDLIPCLQLHSILF